MPFPRSAAVLLSELLDNFSTHGRSEGEGAGGADSRQDGWRWRASCYTYVLINHCASVIYQCCTGHPFGMGPAPADCS